MRSRSLLLLCFLLFTASVSAQQPVTASKGVGWNHPGVDVHRFQLGVDGVFVDVPGGAVPRSAPLPAMTVGLHTLAVRACFDEECAVSDSLAVRLVLVIAPDNLHIIDLPPPPPPCPAGSVATDVQFDVDGFDVPACIPCSTTAEGHIQLDVDTFDAKRCASNATR